MLEQGFHTLDLIGQPNRTPRLGHVFAQLSKVIGGQVIDHPVHAVDLAPTFFELAGATAGHVLDGESLVPLLETGRPGVLANSS